MVSTTKLRDAAQRHYTAGKFGKAKEAYQELTLVEETNPRWPHKLGEIYQRLGERDKAMSAYEDAVVRYAHQGFLLKAIAVCRMILGLDPQHHETQELLAELYARQHGPGPEPTPDPHLPVAPPSAAKEHEPVWVEEGFDEPTDQGMDEMGGEVLVALDDIDLVDVLQSIPVVRLEQEQDDVFEITIDEVEVRPSPGKGNGSGEAETLLQRMPPTPLFSSLDKPALRLLIERVQVHCYQAGEVVIQQGASGSSLFVLVEGNLVVFCTAEDGIETEMTRLSEGAFFGEIALLTELERSATVRTLDECIVLEIGREVIQELLSTHPPVLKVMLRFFRERLVNTLVRTHPLFMPFSTEERWALAGRFSFIEAKPGAVLVDPNEHVDGLYIFICGGAELQAAGGGELQSAAGTHELVVGEVFGESALINDELPGYGVSTRSKCWLLHLPRAAFRELIMTHPMVLESLADVSSRLSANGSSSVPVL